MDNVAHFMGDDAGNFVRVIGFLQQPVEKVDLAARQRKGIPHRGGKDRRLQRHVDVAGPPQRLDQFGKSSVPRRIATDCTAEYRVRLIVGHVAETPFERERNERNQPLGDERHAEKDDRRNRHDCGNRPGDNAKRLLAAAMIGVKKSRASTNFSLDERIGDFEARERPRRERFEPKCIQPAVGAAQIVVAP